MIDRAHHISASHHAPHQLHRSPAAPDAGAAAAMSDVKSLFGKKKKAATKAKAEPPKP